MREPGLASELESARRRIEELEREVCRLRAEKMTVYELARGLELALDARVQALERDLRALGIEAADCAPGLLGQGRMRAQRHRRPRRETPPTGDREAH